MRWRRYPAYQNNNRPWLGYLPDKWEIKRIKQTTYVKGRIGWQGLRSDEFIDEGPCLVTGTDFLNGKVNWHSCYHVSDERYSEDPYIHLQEGDLLITKDGTIGKVAIVKDLQGKATLNSGVFLTRQITDHCLTEYIYWVLNSKVFINFTDYTKAGSTISHLYQNVFVEFAFPVPSLVEQRTIAAFLDRETERIDTLIAKKERQIELLQEKRTALISHAVTKGLDPSVKLKPSGVKWLGDLPEHWAVLALKRIVDTPVTDGPHETPEIFDEGIPFVSAEAIKNDKIDFTKIRGFISIEDHKRYSLKYKPRRNDIYIIKSGATTGNVAMVETDDEFNIWSPLAAIRPSLKISFPRFLFHFIKSREFMTSIQLGWSFGTQQNIGMNVIENLFVTLPPLPEQQAIAVFLDRETGKIDTLIAKVEEAIAKLKEYRTTLISAAVTGKIDVRNEVA